MSDCRHDPWLAVPSASMTSATLPWLAGRAGSDLADPMIVPTGRHAYRRPDGVAVVPLALLGP